MAKPAYILLNADGTVARTHSPDMLGLGTPSTSSTDLEALINYGYQAQREIPLEGGKVLLVLVKV